MAIISNGTTVASGGSVQGSGANLTNLPSSAPTTSQVLSATASASVGAVGTYAQLWINGSTRNPGDTLSSNDLQFGPITGNTASGTWRIMGKSNDDDRVSVWLRIS